MSEFEYLSLLVSIIVAFALSEIFAGWGQMIRGRDHVKVYWVHIAATLLVAALIIQFWWSAWQYRELAINFENKNVPQREDAGNSFALPSLSYLELAPTMTTTGSGGASPP